MAVSVDMQHTGDPNMQAEVRAVVEHVLADRSGDLAGFDHGVSSERPVGIEDNRAECIRAVVYSGGFCRGASTGGDPAYFG
jgi:coenzyme F420-reducing hydrogenase gamma subunit